MIGDVKLIGHNVDIDAAKPGDQTLLAIPLDVSASMRKYKELVIEALDLCKETIKTSKGSIQVSLTTFGENVEMHAYCYVDDLKINYSPDESGTRFYDAIGATAENMINQLSEMGQRYGAKGGIIGFTDGFDNMSKPDSKAKAIKAIRTLREETNTPVIIGLLGRKEEFPALVDFCEVANIELQELKDGHQIRRLLKLFTQSVSSNVPAKKIYEASRRLSSEYDD